MNLKARVAIMLFMLAILTTSTFAGEIEELLKNSPDPSKFEDANVLILFSEKSYELTNDCKSVEETQYLVKVLNNKGRGKYGDQKVAFNTEKDKLSLIKAGTYKNDLSFVSIEDKAINDVTPVELAGAQIYANFLHRVFSFPVVENGSTLLMHYKKITDLKDDNNLSDRVYLQSDEPIFSKKVTISIPNQKKLIFKIIGFESTLNIEKGKDKNIYTIQVKDVPMVKSEENMPPFAEIAKNILFSTCQSWNEAALPFSRKFFKACEITPEIAATASQLTKSALSSEEKIKAISLFIAQKVRNVDLKLGKVGYEPHKAAEVLKNKYGDCRDKSVLMITLLASCGIESYPALINSSFMPIIKEVPTLTQFDKILIAIPREKGYLFLDPFGNMSQFGFVRTELTSEALIIKPKSIEFSPVIGYSPIESKALNTVSGSLSENGEFRGKIESNLYGLYDSAARYNLYDLRGKKLQMFFEETAEEFNPETQTRETHMTDPFDLSKNMEISFSADAPGFALRQDSLMVIKVPEFPLAFSKYSYSPSLTSRKYPYNLGTFSENLYLFRIKIPQEYKPLYMPEFFEIKKDYGTFSLKCEFSNKTSEISFLKYLKFTKNRIEIDEYNEFKKNLERFDLTQNNLIIIKK